MDFGEGKYIFLLRRRNPGKERGGNIWNIFCGGEEKETRKRRKDHLQEVVHPDDPLQDAGPSG